MFNHSDLKWVKNVKRNNGTGWAYFEEGYEREFPLNFSDTQVKGARDLRPGELILLFQRVDNISGIAKQTYLTHIVTPKDNLLNENPNLDHRFKWERNVVVIARPLLGTEIFTSARELSFYKPGWGKICGVDLLSETKSVDEIQREIWRMFNGHFRDGLEDYLKSPDITDESIDNNYSNYSAMEGAERIILRKHLSRERNPVIIGLAKLRAIERGNGKVQCECCDFDFLNTYPDHGYGFIECHHKLPISAGGERRTTLDDLAMVCSNCHRMLHRKIQGTIKYHTVESLRNLIVGT